jgi:hypothetical protein
VAQEATETPEAGTGQVSATSPIVCEASVILLAGVARHDYGFTLPDDFDTFERGQYGFLFEDEGDTTRAGAEATAEADMTTTEEAMEKTEEPGMEATPETSMTETLMMLGEPVIVDENIRCTELRSSLLQFFIMRPSISGMGMEGGAAEGGSAGG